MRPASHLQRFVAVLMLVGVWTLTLVWHDRCEIVEEQQLGAHGPCEGTDPGPATEEAPRFGVDDESRAGDDDSVLESTELRAMRAVAELDRPAVDDAIVPRYLRTPRIARGPPTLA
ncbi:MAG TPA: hypothetical protein VFG69_20965 [Nannocystaceae bacterium]|nr:hypothetical protein [Nannocystaceae bacterium]